MAPAELERLTVVDGLRGLAAFAVCWYHFTNGNSAFLPEGWLKWSGSYGWSGVDVFFVISGFIIPFAMARRGYRFGSDAGRFVAKRILRLDPPYLVAAALSLALWYVSSALPGFRGVVPQVSAAQVFSHLGYLNGLLGLPWLNPVFWSLAIEFQFYVLIAVVFPIVAHSNASVRTAGLASVWAVSMMPAPPTLVFHYLGLFGCGLACFHRSRGWLGPVGFLATVAAMSAAFWYVDNGLSALVAAGTALTIAWVAVGSRVGTWLGGISYSLYLTHLLIGGRIVNAGVRFAHTLPVQGLLLAAALAASIAAAAVFSWLVEQPAQRWSAAIRYRGQAGAGAVR